MSKTRPDGVTHWAPSRRTVVKTLALGGCAAASSAMTGCTMSEIYGELESVRVDFDLQDSTYSALQSVGGMVPVDEGGWKVVLVRVSDESVVALDRMCPHAWCDMHPDLFGVWAQDSLICTCHGSRFDAQGKVIAGPSEQDIPAYDVVFDAESQTGTLQIELGMMPSAEAEQPT